MDVLFGTPPCRRHQKPNAMWRDSPGLEDVSKELPVAVTEEDGVLPFQDGDRTTTDAVLAVTLLESVQKDVVFSSDGAEESQVEPRVECRGCPLQAIQ